MKLPFFRYLDRAKLHRSAVHLSSTVGARPLLPRTDLKSRKFQLHWSPNFHFQFHVHVLKNINMSSNANNAHHELLKPLSWLFGKWKSNQGKGKYPTLSDFQYAEEAEFFPIGMKPMIQFNFSSWHPVNETPMHRETGFIRLQPGSNKIAFIVSHNVGVVEIQEGEVKDHSLKVETTELGRASFNKPPAVKKLIRTLTRSGDRLEQVVDMETERTGMTEHLRITFDKAAQ